MSTMKQTPLFALHQELGGKMVPFAGYSMPVQYPLGVKKEYEHTRRACGLFDVSHMGQVRVTGPSPAAAMETLVTADVVGLAEGGQRYALFTNSEGGILDDLMIVNHGDSLYVVVNAACKDQDIALMRTGLGTGHDVEVLDRGLLAVQGPQARDVMQRLCPAACDLVFMQHGRFEVMGHELWISRSGYTGEDGFEISVPAEATEALARWFHPTRGEIPPDQFIPVAEECGAIVTLGNWLTGEAARAAAAWPDDISVAVNLSPMQIKAPGAALGILSAIRDAGLSPDRLELEITENVFLEDSPSIAMFIEDLARAGVRFALDDFGTGYSSLSYINQWPFSKIKVDRSFVSGAQAGRKSDAIIRAVSQMGRTLGIEIVAEGLETTEQVKAVRFAGCTLGQGYHFSRAIPAYQASLLLAEDRSSQNNDTRSHGTA